MVSKNQFVLGSFETVDDVIEILRGLKKQGCPNEDIVLVTRENYEPIYASQMEGRFATEDEVMGNDVSGATEDDSVWDKVKNVFSVETNGYSTTGQLDYSTDNDPLYGYQESLDQGSIVVMVSGDKWLRAAERNDRERSTTTSKEQATIDGGVLEEDTGTDFLQESKPSSENFK